MHVQQCTEKHGLNIIHVLQNLPYSSSLCEFGKLKTTRASVVYFSEGNWVLERQKKRIHVKPLRNMHLEHMPVTELNTEHPGRY